MNNNPLGKMRQTYIFQATSLTTQESTVKALKSTLDKIDPMDYKTIKSVNDETNRIKKALKVVKPKNLSKSLTLFDQSKSLRHVSTFQCFETRLK